MREVHISEITETVARLSQEANYYLPEDVVDALKKARLKERESAWRQKSKSRGNKAQAQS